MQSLFLLHVLSMRKICMQVLWTGGSALPVCHVAPWERAVLVGATSDALLLVRGSAEKATDVVAASGAELIVRPAHLGQVGGAR